MKFGQFLDKLDAHNGEEVKVSVWAKDKVYTMESPCGYIWKDYNVERDKSIWDGALDEYRNMTLVSCYLYPCNGCVELEVTVK